MSQVTVSAEELMWARIVSALYEGGQYPLAEHIQMQLPVEEPNICATVVLSIDQKFYALSESEIDGLPAWLCLTGADGYGKPFAWVDIKQPVTIEYMP